MKYLVIDVGNTNIVFAIYKDDKIEKNYRISTLIKRTRDEYISWLKSIIDNENDFKDIIVGSVVPDIIEELKLALYNFFGKKVLVINEDIEVNFLCEVDNKNEVGTDRLVNALCAWKIYKKPAIIIDFGTATTFDVVGKEGSYLGGIISPGVNLSMSALHLAAARLPRVAITRPKKIIGKNTVEAMSSGIYWGYIGLINSLLSKIENELNYSTTIIATGGLSELFVNEIRKKVIINNNLTINGLFMAYKESRIKHEK